MFTHDDGSALKVSQRPHYKKEMHIALVKMIDENFDQIQEDRIGTETGKCPRTYDELFGIYSRYRDFKDNLY